ncbi:MAG: hypothetical protein EZS28_055354, partial [Streblomastix strix]
YGRALIISISSAGGIEEYGDWELFNGLVNISRFLGDIHQGKRFYPSFPPLPVLAKTCEEQIEEEGGSEEVDAQLINNNNKYCNVKYYADLVKVKLLNIYIDLSNTRQD